MEAKRALTPVNIFPQANGDIDHDDSGNSFGSDIENKEYFSTTNSDHTSRMQRGPDPKQYPSSPHQHLQQAAHFSHPQYTSSDASRKKATPDTTLAALGHLRLQRYIFEYQSLLHNLVATCPI